MTRPQRAVGRAPAPRSPRAVAAEGVAAWLTTGAYPDRLIQAVDRDRAFVMEALYGVIRRRRSLEWIVRPLLRRPPPTALRACLYVGLYQLLFMDTVAPHAAVNETVETAKAIGGPRAAGFVNRLLRRVADDLPGWRARLAAAPLGIRESMPDLLLRHWTRTYGAARTEALCRWHNARPRVTLQLRLDRAGSMAAYLARLREQGLDAEPHPFHPASVLILPPGASVPALPGFAEGAFTVQDPATRVAVELLDPQPGERILDACAAPGGKALLIAERLAGSGDLVALEPHPDRLVELRANAERLGAPMRVVRGDARRTVIDPAVDEAPFDRILADVPCTNTGVLRRRPDARWRFTVPRLRAACRRQREILDALAPRLKPGGVLVYSTCSLEPEENEHIVQSWLARHPDFVLERSVTLFPPETETDGAYAAALRHVCDQ